MMISGEIEVDWFSQIQLIFEAKYRVKYSRMNQVKFLEDSP